MTTNTVLNLYGRYLDWREKGQAIKELPDITVEEMQQVYEDEVQTAHDLEVERQVDFALIAAENN